MSVRVTRSQLSKGAALLKPATQKVRQKVASASMKSSSKRTNSAASPKQNIATTTNETIAPIVVRQRLEPEPEITLTMNRIRWRCHHLIDSLTSHGLKEIETTTAIANKVGESTTTVGNSSPYFSQSKRAKKPEIEVADIEDLPLWRRHVDNIRQMRSAFDAPVDTMGCEKLMDSDAPRHVQHFQVLVALMLSSQTKDEVTSAAVKRLIDHGCTVQNIRDTEEEKLRELIYPVGFYKRKAEYLRKASQLIIDKFDGLVPSTVADLCSLPGVGPKMAHLQMLVANDTVTGIAVDTHVHRIANRLGWTPKPTTEPEQTRHAIEALIPKDLWREIKLLLVGFGQQVCGANKPSCATCLNQPICPYALKNYKPKKQ